jgi:LysM repeat protein
MKRHQNLSRWLLRLIFFTGIGIQLNGCVTTSPGVTEEQLAASAFPGVDFIKLAPVQVDYANNREILLGEVIAVLDELDEEIDKIDRANYIITTKVRKYAQLVKQEGNQSDPSTTYQSVFKLTVVEKGTGVGMETIFSKEKRDSGQFASGSNIVRQLFFHQLNSRLMPFLFTFRDGGSFSTRSVVDVLNLKVIKYTVKRNETLSMIALKYTANSSNWKTIAAINGIQNPKKLIAGQEILLPVKLLSERYRKNGIIDEPSLVRKKKVKVVKPQGRKKIPKDDRSSDCFGCN